MKTLVLGASPKPERYSNRAMRMLKEHGYEVEGLGLREATFGDFSILAGKPKLEKIHTISLYIGPKNQPEWYNYIVDTKPERVIFNPGTENPELYQILEEAGIAYEVACTLVLLSTNQYN